MICTALFKTIDRYKMWVARRLGVSRPTATAQKLALYCLPLYLKPELNAYKEKKVLSDALLIVRPLEQDILI